MTHERVQRSGISGCMPSVVYTTEISRKVEVVAMHNASLIGFGTTIEGPHHCLYSQIYRKSDYTVRYVRPTSVVPTLPPYC
jgi:hypothetical protein